MKHDIFISYANSDSDFIENFRGCLKIYGVDAWVYSRDRTFASDTWEEITTKIKSTEYMLYAISNYTPEAIGQEKELEIALDKYGEVIGFERIIPIVLNDTPFNLVPEKIRKWNGERLTPKNINTVSLTIAQQLFPYKFKSLVGQPWHFPIPGNWIEVSGLHEQIEDHVGLNDHLYFRQISPMGLFECYCPKTKGLIWVSPNFVKVCECPAENRPESSSIPFEYSVSGLISIHSMGWSSWHEKHDR